MASSIPGDALLGNGLLEIRGDGGATVLGSNDFRVNRGDAVLFWRDIFGTGWRPFKDPGALGTRDNGTKVRPVAAVVLLLCTTGICGGTSLDEAAV